MNFNFFLNFVFITFPFLVLAEPPYARRCSFWDVTCVNCPGFQICEEGLHKILECDEGIKCTNDEMAQCWMKLKRGKDGDCTESGIFPVINTYNEYYVCSKDSFGFLKQKFICPRGFLFDQTELTCLSKSNFLFSFYNSDGSLVRLTSKFSMTPMTTITTEFSTTPQTTTTEPSTIPTTTTTEPSTTQKTTTTEPSTTPTTTTTEPSTTKKTTTTEPSTTPTITTDEPSTTPTTTTTETFTTLSTKTPNNTPALTTTTTPMITTTPTVTTMPTITTTSATTVTPTSTTPTSMTPTFTTPTPTTTPVTTSTTETTPSPLICSTAGIFPHPSNCKMYYSMEITAFCREQISKNSTVVETLPFDENVTEGAKAVLLFMTPPKINNFSPPTESIPTTKAPLKQFSCKQRGRFLHPTNCNAYYRCSVMLKPHLYFCPKGNYFNEFTKECTPKIPDRCQELNQF